MKKLYTQICTNKSISKWIQIQIQISIYLTTEQFPTLPKSGSN